MDLRIENIDELIDFFDRHELTHFERSKIIRATLNLITTSSDKETTLNQLRELKANPDRRKLVFLGKLKLSSIEATGLVAFE